MEANADSFVTQFYGFSSYRIVGSCCIFRRWMLLLCGLNVWYLSSTLWCVWWFLFAFSNTSKKSVPSTEQVYNIDTHCLAQKSVIICTVIISELGILWHCFLCTTCLHTRLFVWTVYSVRWQMLITDKTILVGITYWKEVDASASNVSFSTCINQCLYMCVCVITI